MRWATGGCSDRSEQEAAVRLVEGQLVVGEVAGQVLGEAETRRIGVGGVLAMAPVGGPERAQQRLGAAATGEAQCPPRAAEERAAGALLIASGRLHPALGLDRAERVAPDFEALEGLGEAHILLRRRLRDGGAYRDEGEDRSRALSRCSA